MLGNELLDCENPPRLNYNPNMEFLTNEDFFVWAGQHGIARDPRYPQIVSFVPKRGDDRFWQIPFNREERWQLMVACLEALDPFTSCWIFKREGSWSFVSEHGAGSKEKRIDKIIKSIGVPDNYTGSLRFGQADQGHLLRLLAGFAQFGSNTLYDLFLVPDHGRQLLWLDHEDALWVFFSELKPIAPFVQNMKDAGFNLPTEAPPAIAWQHWMGPRAGGLEALVGTGHLWSNRHRQRRFRTLILLRSSS